MKAKVYQAGRYWDSVREVNLPAVVIETSPSLEDGKVVYHTNTHILTKDECYCVGANASYKIEWSVSERKS